MADIIVGGVYNGPGVNVSILGNSVQTLNMTDTAAYVPGYRLKELSAWIVNISAAGASVRYNLYDVSAGAAGAVKIYEVELVVPEGHTTSGYVTLPLGVELEGLTGGEILAIGRTSKVGPGTYSTKASTGTSSTALAGTTGPNPWDETGTTAELYDAHFVLAEGGTLVSVNDGSPVVVGEAIAAVTSGITAVGMTVGDLEVDDFTAVDGDNYTAVMPFFADGQIYPFMGSVTALVYDAEEPANEAELSTTLQLPAGWASVTYATLSTDEDSLAERIEGAVIETGDYHYYETADITLYDDSTFADAPSGTVVTWLHKAATGVTIQVNIINGVPVVPGAGGAGSLLLRPYATIGDYPILNPPINR